MKGMHFKTIGRRLVENVSKAKDKKELLSALKDACCKTATPEKVEKELGRMDFPSGKEVAKLKATMARVRINNAEAKFQKTLAAAKKPEQVKKLLHKYLQSEKMFSKAQDYAVIGMDAYLEKGFGSADDFRKDLKKTFAPEMAMEQHRQRQETYA